MARLTAEQRLERARQIKAKAEAEIRSASAKLREDDRRADTRRKIILGAIVIDQAKKAPKFAAWLREQIKILPEKDRKAFEGWDIQVQSTHLEVEDAREADS